MVGHADEPRTTLALLAEQIASCRRCPRLTEYCSSTSLDGWWARPVPGSGDPTARLVLVGLAPSLRGANAHGRMFTGDPSAATLTRALFDLGLASAPTSTARDDGLVLNGVWLTAAARCAPPRNRPLAAELSNCRDWLRAELDALPWRSAVALGSVAWSALGTVLGAALPPFAHGARARHAERSLFASYHPSPQNTNTGRLTLQMLEEVLQAAYREALEDPPR